MAEPGHRDTENFHEDHVPFQIPIYVRRTIRDRYTFSHVRHTTLRKFFPRTLSVRDLSRCQELRKLNEKTYQTDPVLILVTGDTGEIVSYESFVSKRKSTFKFDLAECQSVSEEHRVNPTFSDLNRGFMAISMQCTVACYERGAFNNWAITNVIPILSDWLIIPRILSQKSIGGIVYSYSKAAKKALADSRLMAEEHRIKETDLSEMRPRKQEYSPEKGDSIAKL